MNTRTQNTTRISILVRPRFSLLHVSTVALLLAVVVIGGRTLNKQPPPAGDASGRERYHARPQHD